MKKVVIAGGSGLIGSAVSDLLKNKGYEVVVLSRSLKAKTTKGMSYWDVEKGVVDKALINSCDYIINLAGAGIADKRWTASRKKEIINSREKSGDLLCRAVDVNNRRLQAYVTASGVGYYGAVTSDKIFKEEDFSGSDFLSEVCVKWEKEATHFSERGIRTVILRTGVVLSKNGGAFPQMTSSIKWGLGVVIGMGKQYLPWIHIDDISQLYKEALENEKMKGIYNAVAPKSYTYKAFIKSMARFLEKRILTFYVPKFMLKIVLGERSVLLCEGSRVSAKKLEKELNYTYLYPSIEDSLKQLMG